MESDFLVRMSEQLRAQRRTLLEWLKGTPGAARDLRLGTQPPEAVEAHVHVLEDAIARADAGELGRCTVCHEHVESHWLQMDYTTSVCIEHLTGEERSQLEAELELSQRVQRALLPRETPSIPGFDVAAFSQPASIVGGDYFDFLRFADGVPAVIIADVMGKGMPASMLMASLQAYLRVILPESTSPADVLGRLNRLFCHNIQLTKFVSLVVARLTPKDGRFVYGNAGHHPPMLIRRGADGAAMAMLRPTGAAIGLVEGAIFAEAEAEMRRGDILIFYTDGVVEARDPEGREFGDEGLGRYAGENRSAPPGPFVRGLRQRLQEFTAGRPLSDDTTIVAVRRLE
ncbi:MAG: protein serine phosphatase with GAF(s) sensor(s) [Bacteroidetes bacterium]|nr:protein serine phosphatase with GAF(s) sensor(s) [Bacteroidota bacterium]